MEIVMESRLTHVVALQTTPRPSLTCKDKLEYMNNSLHTAASHNIINTILTRYLCRRIFVISNCSFSHEY